MGVAFLFICLVVTFLTLRLVPKSSETQLQNINPSLTARSQAMAQDEDPKFADAGIDLSIARMMPPLNFNISRKGTTGDN